MSEGVTIDGWVCPLPLRDQPNIVMGHGGGGKLSAELVEHLFLPAFSKASGILIRYSPPRFEPIVSVPADPWLTVTVMSCGPRVVTGRAQHLSFRSISRGLPTKKLTTDRFPVPQTPVQPVRFPSSFDQPSRRCGRASCVPRSRMPTSRFVAADPNVLVRLSTLSEGGEME